MKFKKPCKNPHNNVSCELMFVPDLKGKLCESCRDLSSFMAREKFKKTWEAKRNGA